MAKTVRAKFRCITGGQMVSMHAVADGSEENKKFWEATPSGNLDMFISNPEAQDLFEAGKLYYLDFTVAE